MMKTPSNAYRASFLRALFPNARVQVLHLTRNPAAAINGLVDGWRFRGFHAHRLAQPHAIEGAPERDWWKYDLPPGWQDWTNRSLVEVAGFQWRSAHARTSSRPGEKMRCRSASRTSWVRTAWRPSRAYSPGWAPISTHPCAQSSPQGCPVVMATERPRQRRWFARAELLEPVLADPEVNEVAEALGYTDRADWT